MDGKCTGSFVCLMQGSKPVQFPVSSNSYLSRIGLTQTLSST